MPDAPRLFRLSAGQVNWLVIVGFLAVGEAVYVRYLAIEYAPVSLACQGGLQTWLCTSFRLAIVLYNHSVFGWVALHRGLAQPACGRRSCCSRSRWRRPVSGWCCTMPTCRDLRLRS